MSGDYLGKPGVNIIHFDLPPSGRLLASRMRWCQTCPVVPSITLWDAHDGAVMIKAIHYLKVGKKV